MLEGGLLRNSYMVECGNTNAMHWAHCLVHVHGRPLCPTLGVPGENRPKIEKRQILKMKVIVLTTTIKEGFCTLFFRPKTHPKTALQCFALEQRES